jgi:hypothetical protein
MPTLSSSKGRGEEEERYFKLLGFGASVPTLLKVIVVRFLFVFSWDSGFLTRYYLTIVPKSRWLQAHEIAGN